jgi:hypothetical protein
VPGRADADCFPSAAVDKTGTNGRRIDVDTVDSQRTKRRDAVEDDFAVGSPVRRIDTGIVAGEGEILGGRDVDQYPTVVACREVKRVAADGIGQCRGQLGFSGDVEHRHRFALPALPLGKGRWMRDLYSGAPGENSPSSA